MNIRLSVAQKHLTRTLALAAVAMAMALASNVYAQTSGNLSSLARPKVAHDGSVLMPNAAYDPKFFFEEGKDYDHLDAHVFVEPLIRMETEAHKGLKFDFDEKNQLLVLYFRTDVDRAAVIDGLRRTLLSTAKSPVNEIAKGTEPYRLGLLDTRQMSRAWFETEKVRDVNGELRPIAFSRDFRGSFNSNGVMEIHFPVIENHQSVEDLMWVVEENESILFRYEFAGVNEELCSATATASELQNTSYFRAGGGAGSQSAVTRNQLAQIASEVASRQTFRTRCGDPKAAEQVMALLMQIMQQQERSTIIEVNSWQQLSDYLTFDPNDFKADLRTATGSLENEVDRKIIEDAIAESESTAEATAEQASTSGGARGSVIGFGSAGANFARNTSESMSRANASAKAKKAFSDTLAKRGVKGEWEGAAYTPREIQVHTDADLRTALRSGLTVEYAFTAPGIGIGSVSVNNPDTFLGSHESERDRLARLENSLKSERDRLTRLENSLKSERDRAARLEAFVNSVLRPTDDGGLVVAPKGSLFLAPEGQNSHVVIRPQGKNADVFIDPRGADGEVFITPMGVTGNVFISPQGEAGMVWLSPKGKDGMVFVAPEGRDGDVRIDPRGADANVWITPNGRNGHVIVRPEGLEGSVVIDPRGANGDVVINPEGEKGDVWIIPEGDNANIFLEPRGNRGDIYIDPKGSGRVDYHRN
jgi:hypothetical protein